MRARQRSNPWPAVADLFAGLLVATFAGLVLVAAISVKEKKEYEEILGGIDPDESRDAMALIRDLKDEKQALEGEIEEYEAKTRDLEEELELQGETLRNFRAVQSNLEEQLTSLRNQLGRGIDPPPCLVDDEKKVLSVVEITIRSGTLEVERISRPGYERLLDRLDALGELIAAGELPYKDFNKLAVPVRNRARDPSNAFGFSCVLFADVSIETDSKAQVSTALAYIDDAFYIANTGAVDRFMKSDDIQ